MAKIILILFILYMTPVLQCTTCMDFKYPIIHGDNSGDTVFTAIFVEGTDTYVGGHSSATQSINYGGEI